VAVAAAGVAIASVGIAMPRPFEICAGSSCEPGDTFDARGTGSLVPIGYSLLGMGSAWTLGAILGSERSAPWIEFAAGVVIFGASYGLSLALREDTPCQQSSMCFDETR
jgi:hypothetical protein